MNIIVGFKYGTWSLFLDFKVYTFFSNPGSEIKERLSSPKILPSPTSEAVPSTVMSGFSALGSLCSAYASESEDDEEQAGIFKYSLLKV